jgi:AraC-like DNA-binding protein
MSVSGTSPGEMAATTGLSETYITRLLSEKRNKTFNKLRDEYKRKNLKNVVGPV